MKTQMKQQKSNTIYQEWSQKVYLIQLTTLPSGELESLNGKTALANSTTLKSGKLYTTVVKIMKVSWGGSVLDTLV